MTLTSSERQEFDRLVDDFYYLLTSPSSMMTELERRQTQEASQILASTEISELREDQIELVYEAMQLIGFN